MKDKSSGQPIDVSTWQFSAVFIREADGSTAFTATTSNGNFTVSDAGGPNGEVQFQILAADTTTLPIDKIIASLMRTDASPGPVRIARIEVNVADL